MNEELEQMQEIVDRVGIGDVLRIFCDAYGINYNNLNVELFIDHYYRFVNNLTQSRFNQALRVQPNNYQISAFKMLVIGILNVHVLVDFFDEITGDGNETVPYKSNFYDHF